MITASGIDQLPYNIQNALKKFNTGALLAVPILSGDGVIDGFMGFDDSKWREWTPDEIIMLWNLCKMMSGYVEATRLAARDWVNNGAERFTRNILNNTGFNVLALDIETNDVLWANEAMCSKSGRGNGATTGEPGICPIHLMSDDEDGRSGPISIERRGEQSEQWDRSLVIYDGVIEWEYGRKARIELALGAAEHNMTREQLEYFSAIDPLTGALNRNALLSKMSGILSEAHTESTTVSIALINVDKLKFVNENYGHGAGGMVLDNIVKALRTYIRGDDVLGRIWGDKFVIVFPACDSAVAERRMVKAKNYLVMSKTTAIAEKISFSYGIAQNTEFPYDGSRCLDELLNLANRRMMENKNIASINKKAVAV
jgi:diguanylate cyclase (GGDEF)-like protein